jgi:hypothetical protein
MAKGTKKQHFVPQLLLRQFARANEHLYTYDKAGNRSFPTSVRDSGHQNHFLSMPALDGNDGPGAYFERLFQTFEGPAMTALRQVSAAIAAGARVVIGPQERKALARFIAIQYLRTPAARDTMAQAGGLIARSLAEEIARRNDFDISDPEIARVIDAFAAEQVGDPVEMHAEQLRDPAFIEDVATRLSGHVWLLGTNRTGKLLYVADHPVTLHGHAARPGRGLGLVTYGVEVMLPLSSTLQLSLYERRFVRTDVPHLEPQDGTIAFEMDEDNVLFARTAQVAAARQFVYCEADDFEDARVVCDAHPELRKRDRARMDGTAFGRPVRPD